MRYNILGLVAVLAGFSLTGCSDEMPDGISTAPRGDLDLEMTLGAAYPTLSRASDAGFEDGDRMGVYVVDYDGEEAPGIDSEGIRASNVRFTFNGSNNSWTGVPTIYWKDGKTPVDIVAYYPYVSNIDNPCRLSHSVSSRQDVAGSGDEMGGYESSDLLIARSVKAMPTTERVELTFRHAMAGLRITLQEGSGFADGEWTEMAKTVVVNNVRPDAEVDLTTGNIESASGDPTNIVAYEYADDYRAVVVPQTVAAGADVVTITVDGVTYRLVKDASVTYTAGKLHIFTIKVDKRNSTGDYEFTLVDEAITAWLDDVEFRDGLMRQYVTVEVEECGTLEECIKKLSSDPTLITNLKVVGPIDSQDFTYLREQMPVLKSLNLKNAVCYNEGTPNVIPMNALQGKKTLSRVVFPDGLTEIRGGAFMESGLMGDLIIPEGVKRIEGYEPGFELGAFAKCTSLTGKLSLPSTLEYIGPNCFMSSPLSGSLLLPSSLKRIEFAAFSICNFSGELVIPESVEDIGEEAFYGNKFSGDLILNSGLKIIRENVFSSIYFGGTLVLPEGLEEIRAGAFWGCKFKGELNLPESLRFIGDNAFRLTTFSGVTFGKNVSYIGDYAFAGCNRLKGDLVIPQKVVRVNDYSFAFCSLLESVVMHEDVAYVGVGALGNCVSLTKIVCDNPEPPLTKSVNDPWEYFYCDPDQNLDLLRIETVTPFTNLSMDNFSLEVPAGSEDAYGRAKGWSEFRRITAYSGFVCRPSTACALNTAHEKDLVIDADGAWTLEHKPDWCSLSATSGNQKTSVTLTINELSRGAGNRADSLVFRLDGTDFTTICRISQYDYQYGEDETVKLQSATRGNGVDIVFIGDGFDAQSIASGAYLTQVSRQMEYFFGLEPYITYRDYFNVYAIMSLSQETGVNTLSTYRDTRFQTFYGGSGTDTAVPQLNLYNSDEVFEYVMANSPVSYEGLRNGLVIMSMNSDEYGGATYLFEDGRAISICSPSQESYPNDSRGIVQHEAGGHGFGKLGDEVVRYHKFAPDRVIKEINSAQGYGLYRNLSTSGKMTDVAWSHFIFDPRYSNAVDIFEGGYGYTRFVYRSEINSCMNYGIPYYNAISRQAIVERILNNSGEGFTMDKFYANDSSEWGSTGGSRAAVSGTPYGNGTHRPVTIVKDKIKRKIK